jgi:hypothetical protein
VRKLLVLFAAALMTAGIALPANAATHTKPSSYRSSGTSADAFWYRTKWLTNNTYRQTVWYVGVYQSSDGTFSDAYKTVVDCTEEPGEEYEECSLVSSSYGYSDLSGDTFTIAKKLASAHLEASYRMRTYTEKGARSGSSFTIDVVVDWTQAGSLQRSHSESTYRDGCYLFHDSSRGAWRSTTATGSVNTRALRSTDESSISKYASRYLEKIC